MKVIAVISLKGGAGKTTTALTIAEGLRLRGQRVVVVDLDTRDRQATARVWSEVAAELGLEEACPVIPTTGRELRKTLLALDADVAVVDTPPAMGPEARAAMACAHLIVLPVAQGAADVWALRSALDTLAEVAAGRPDGGAPVVAVLNKLDMRTATGRGMREAIEAAGLHCAVATLGHRVAFQDALPMGASVFSYAPNGAAALEAGALLDELAA